MSACNRCGGEIEWGYMDGRYVPLEPIDLHADLDRRYKDENGILRADHRDRHGNRAVDIRPLGKKVKAANAERQQPSRSPEPEPITIGTPWWKRFGRSVAT